MEQTERKYKIKARIFSMEDGHEGFDNIKSIYVESKKYNILIMEDYLPVIGDIDGNIVIKYGTNEIREIKNIQGFFKHSHNEFSLLIKRKGQNAW